MIKAFYSILVLIFYLNPNVLVASDFNYNTGLALKAKKSTSATITAMHQHNEKILAIGVHGIILSSTDTGTSWNQAESVPFSNTLTDVQCITESQCWAIGHDSTVLHSIDGGNNWSIQYSDEFFDAPLLSIHMSDYLNGLAIGAFGSSLSTSDGGETWGQSLVTDDPYEPHLNYIFSQDDLTFVVGELGQVHISSDRGKTWKLVETGYFGSLWGGIAVNKSQLILLGMSGKVLLVTFEDENFNKFSLETVFIGIKNSLTEIKKLKNGNYIISGNGGVVSIIDLDNKITETCIRGDRLSNTSVIEVSNDEYLLSGENGFRFHSMSECKENYEITNSPSKDVWIKTGFQYLNSNYE